MRDMVFLQKRHFKEFLQSDEKIATNILTSRLARLESLGIISKQTDPDSKRQVIYSLTEKGIALIPLLVEFVCWGSLHLDALDADPDAVKKIQNNKPKFVRSLEKKCPPRAAIKEALCC